MTTRRCLLVFGMAAIVALLVVGWLLWPRSAIKQENAAKIQVGMTMAEVEAILGGSARWDTSDPFIIAPADFDGPVNFPTAGCEEALTQKDGEVVGWRRGWVSVRGRALVVVRFDCDNRVTEIQYGPVSAGESSIITLIRRWLRL